MKVFKEVTPDGKTLIYIYTMNVDKKTMNVNYSTTLYGGDIIEFSQDSLSSSDTSVEVAVMDKLYLWDKRDQTIYQYDYHSTVIKNIHFKRNRTKRIDTKYKFVAQYARIEGTEPKLELLFGLMDDEILLSTEQVEELLEEYEKI